LKLDQEAVAKGLYDPAPVIIDQWFDEDLLQLLERV